MATKKRAKKPKTSRQGAREPISPALDKRKDKRAPLPYDRAGQFLAFQLGPGSKPKKADRLRAVTQLMACGQWVTGVSGPELADYWGLSLSSIERDAAEASRRIAEAVDDEDIKGRFVAGLESLTRTAVNRGELRTAVEAYKTLAQLTGANAPTKVEGSMTISDFLATALDGGENEDDGAPDGQPDEPADE